MHPGTIRPPFRDLRRIRRRVKRDLVGDLDAFGLTAAIGADRLFPTLPTAVAGYEQWCRDERAHRPPE